MRYLLCSALVLVPGCFFDPSGVAGPTPDAADGVVDSPTPPPDSPPGTIDAAPGIDGTDAPPAVGFPYTPSNFDPNPLTPGGSVVLDCAASFDSQSLSFPDWCGQPQPTPVVRQQGGGPDVVILPVGDFTITGTGRLDLSGDRPIILAVFGDADISGAIDASATAANDGPGGDTSPACDGGRGGDGSRNGGNNNGGGGGGGGHGSDGNDGGNGASGGPKGAKGSAVGNEPITPLRGGCAGGRGGASDVQSGGLGGGGGGGVQISTAGALLISALITAGGGGGRAGSSRDGGGGGGSGGAILLEGDTVDIDSAAILTANGGAGGEGGASNSCGGACDHGDDANPVSATPAQGGSGLSSSGGDGGGGGTGMTDPSAGDDGQSGNGGGGGGGGGTGRIRINGNSGCTIQTPLYSPDPTGSGSGCP